MDVRKTLDQHGIQLSAHRIVIGEYVLATADHPSAYRVWTEVRESLPLVSRATVYNTLKLFVEKGLLKELVLEQGRLVFDPNVDEHHHFIDDSDGSIHDIAWECLEVCRLGELEGFEVESYQVVAHGRRR